MTDRLEDAKHLLSVLKVNEWDGLRITTNEAKLFQAVEGLITEVERLRGELYRQEVDAMGDDMPDERDATIATLKADALVLREALEWITNDDQANAYEWQLIARKALATTEHSEDGEAKGEE